MDRLARRIAPHALSAAVAIALALPASNAEACSPVIPDYAEISSGARSIVLYSVTGVYGDPHAPVAYDLTVIRPIKGAAGHTRNVAAPIVSLCGDRLAVLAGTRVLLASDVDLGGELVTPYWEFDSAGRVTLGTAPYQPGDTIESIIERLERAMSPTTPPTDTAVALPKQSAGPAADMVVALGALAALGLVGGWRRARRGRGRGPRGMTSVTCRLASIRIRGDGAAARARTRDSAGRPPAGRRDRVETEWRNPAAPSRHATASRPSGGPAERGG